MSMRLNLNLKMVVMTLNLSKTLAREKMRTSQLHSMVRCSPKKLEEQPLLPNSMIVTMVPVSRTKKIWLIFSQVSKEHKLS